MPKDEIFDGLFLMGVGMGTVFLFLCLLILATEVIRILAASSGDSAPKPAGAPPKGLDDAMRVAVITAAINRFRKEHGKNKS